MLTAEKVFRKLDENKKATFVLISSTGVLKDLLAIEINSFLNRKDVNIHDILNINIILDMELKDYKNLISCGLKIEYIYENNKSEEIKIYENLSKLIQGMFTSVRGLERVMMNMESDRRTLDEFRDNVVNTSSSVYDLFWSLDEILISDSSCNSVYMDVKHLGVLFAIYD